MESFVGLPISVLRRSFQSFGMASRMDECCLKTSSEVSVSSSLTASLGNILGTSSYVMCCIWLIWFSHQPGKKIKLPPPPPPPPSCLSSQTFYQKSCPVKMWFLFDSVHLLSCTKLPQAFNSLL